MLFKSAGVDFKDTRIEFSDWPALKASDDCPHGVLPILKVTNDDGSCFTVSQSMAIGKWTLHQF